MFLKEYMLSSCDGHDGSAEAGSRHGVSNAAGADKHDNWQIDFAG